MKYQVFEMVLNEYNNYPTKSLVDEVEANSEAEANQIARLRFPNRGTFQIGEQQFDK
jgi:hypothetical protein